MRRIVNVFILSLSLMGVVSSCQNTNDKKQEDAIGKELSEKETRNVSPEKAAESEHPGKDVYTKNCLACHQADGSGVPGMHPPLGPGSWVGREPQELIAIMMKGLSGKVEVNGEIYNGFMPSQAQLTDEEIADVLSYIRSSFGNNYDPVEARLVKKIRSGR